jgi:hypothetical protein
MLLLFLDSLLLEDLVHFFSDPDLAIVVSPESIYVAFLIECDCMMLSSHNVHNIQTCEFFDLLWSERFLCIS